MSHEPSQGGSFLPSKSSWRSCGCLLGLYGSFRKLPYFRGSYTKDPTTILGLLGSPIFGNPIGTTISSLKIKLLGGVQKSGNY